MKLLKILLLFLFFLGCKNKNTPGPQKLNTSTQVYLGNTSEVHQMADYYDSVPYTKTDTSYVDTIKASTNNDSITSLHKNKSYKFKVDTSNKYREWYGSHSYTLFQFLKNDTLLFSYYSYSGVGANAFSQTNIDFKGKRK